MLVNRNPPSLLFYLNEFTSFPKPFITNGVHPFVLSASTSSAKEH